ncbi:hypothetical protein K7X08_038107 [Anisodus acutangulus]|uniref:Uncharacterized protein n=1 Tax=Anisodus acutangulus TaxID=402998 RepID=A0A9Q1MYA3_9SOLA|nr:hypothetical protein K7X08_038107 [Anisodus acutangulus]
MSKLRASMRNPKSIINADLDVVMLAEIYILGRVLLSGELDPFVLDHPCESVGVPIRADVRENIECLIAGHKPVQLHTKVSNEDGEKRPIIFSGDVLEVLPVIVIPLRSVPCAADTVVEGIQGESVDCHERIDEPKGSENEYLDVDLEEIVSLASFAAERATNIETPPAAQQPDK